MKPVITRATVIDVISTTQARIVLAINIAKVLIKLNCATAIAFLPSESLPAIEKNSGDIAELPRPARKNPIKAIVNARDRFASTIEVETIKVIIKPAPPTKPPNLIQNCSL
ncbi:MAG: hypothetical protein RI992_400 [Actinomycetota bacterium]